MAKIEIKWLSLKFCRRMACANVRTLGRCASMWLVGADSKIASYMFVFEGDVFNISGRLCGDLCKWESAKK